MVLIKLYSVIGIYSVLNCVQTSGDFKLDYKIAKTLKSMEKDVEFYRNKLQELLNTYAEKDADGKPIRAKDGNGVKVSADFYVKQRELESIETETIIDTFSLEECEKCKFNIKQLLTLDPILK